MSRTQYQRIAQPVLPPNLTPETVSVDRWLEPWSEPVRVKPALNVALRPEPALHPQLPPTPFGWLEPLTDPVRLKRLIPAPELMEVIVPPQASFIWFNWFATPQRFKPGLPPHEQQFIAQPVAPVAVPGTGQMLWFQSLSSIASYTVMIGTE